ncbi:MAG TPA: sigma-70 family RNA polymerase sigma factor [Blastocatellia bacterium]|nr:sigma-70 family RNA polymerase sigma factor [Blastocatellia bacterium]
MTDSPIFSLNHRCQQAYAEAAACHGDLALTAVDFCDRLESSLRAHLGPEINPAAVSALFENWHKTDLYLAMACARQDSRAWERLLALYQDYIQAIARFLMPTADAALEIAGNLPSHLFLPGRTGRCRIAGYDGQAVLATWLRVIITRQAVNERQRKANTHASLDELPDMKDTRALERLERGARSARYAAMIRESFAAACANLSARERLMLLWKYQDGLSSQEIARLLGVHPSTLCRQLQEAYAKLARASTTLLATRHHLSAAAVAECLEEACGEPEYSLLSLIEVRNA